MDGTDTSGEFLADVNASYRNDRAMMQSLNAADQARQTGLAAAVRAHRAGRLREAVAGYEALLRRTPDDADILQLLGLALARRWRALARAAQGR